MKSKQDRRVAMKFDKGIFKNTYTKLLTLFNTFDMRIFINEKNSQISYFIVVHSFTQNLIKSTFNLILEYKAQALLEMTDICFICKEKKRARFVRKLDKEIYKHYYYIF